MDVIAEFSRLSDHVLEHHSIALFFSLGACSMLVGYVGMHWIGRRRFYRRKRRDPLPTYFRCWLTNLTEGWLGLFFLCSVVAGALLLFAGVIDTIDG